MTNSLKRTIASPSEATMSCSLGEGYGEGEPEKRMALTPALSQRERENEVSLPDVERSTDR
jgi:hypothetical protein